MKKLLLIAACAAVVCLSLTSCATKPKTYTGTGSLVIDVSCKDGRIMKCDLFLDDKPIGRAATEKGKLFYHKDKNGPHVLRVEAEGYITAEKEVMLKGKHPGTWARIKLKPVPVPEPAPEPEQKPEDK